MFKVFWLYCDKKAAFLRCFSLVSMLAMFQINVNFPENDKQYHESEASEIDPLLGIKIK